MGGTHQQIERLKNHITSLLPHSNFQSHHKALHRLNQQLDTLLRDEEIRWAQKSRLDWLKFEDKNTKFFHVSTLIRRQHNRIDCLKNLDGNWTTSKNQTKEVL